MSSSEQLDQLLTTLHNGAYYQLFNESSDEEYQAVDKALAYQLIREKGDTYSLTERGHEVVNAGGFDQWKAVSEQRQSEAHRATLDSAKATVDAATYSRHSRNAAWIASGLTFLALLLAIYQVWVSDQQDKKIDAQNQKITALISQDNKILLLLKHQSKTPTAKAVPSRTQRKK